MRLYYTNSYWSHQPAPPPQNFSKKPKTAMHCRVDRIRTGPLRWRAGLYVNNVLYQLTVCIGPCALKKDDDDE
jgi:hypothetical protein